MAVLHEFSIGRARVVYTDRRDGSGRSVFCGANLSFRVGDVPEAVLENRYLIAQKLGVGHQWFEVVQVHGNAVADAPKDWQRFKCSTAPAPEKPGKLGNLAGLKADAIVTTAALTQVAIFVADCVPLAMGSCDPPGIAVVHAGWRGLVSGVVEAAAAQLQEKTGGIDWAIAGPSIGPCCYRVEKDRLDLFEERFGRNCVDRNRSSLDMHAAVVRALESRNCRPLGVISLGPCTACSDQLYSYRRDGPRTGRQALIAWIVEEKQNDEK